MLPSLWCQIVKDETFPFVGHRLCLSQSFFGACVLSSLSLLTVCSQKKMSVFNSLLGKKFDSREKSLSRDCPCFTLR